MQRAALYIRVSTEEQALHGLSIEAQREALDAWAKANHVLVVDHYVDAGISARKPADKRPELQRLLRHVQAGEVDLIVFTKLDRWFRNVSEYYKVQDILDAHHVNWKTIHEDYETVTASGRLKINIMLSVAQDEADRTGERIKAVFDSKRHRGEFVSGTVPMGFRVENKHLVVDEERAKIVRWIFDKYIATRSQPAVTRALLEQFGIDRPPCSLKVMLRNRMYIGEGTKTSGECEPIVSRETFDLAQEILKHRAQRNGAGLSGKGVYLFTGIVFCAECGHRLVGHAVNAYAYYYCPMYTNHRGCTHTCQTNEAKLEKWLLENLLSQCQAYNLELCTKQQQMKQVDTTALKRKMEKLRRLYVNDMMEEADFDREYGELRSVLEEAQINQRRRTKPIDTVQLQDTLTGYSGLPRTAQKEFWSRTLSKIIITKDGDFSITPYLS